MKDDARVIEAKYRDLEARLDEATLRLWAAVEARSLGRGGVSTVAKALGISHTTIYAGLAELGHNSSSATLSFNGNRIRAKGGGRKRLIYKDLTLLRDLDALVSPTTRGDPMSPLCWTCKSTRHLAEELTAMGHEISWRTVWSILDKLGYSMQSLRKNREGHQNPDRDAQFHYILKTVLSYQESDDPVISIDSKKKEKIGDFKNDGREWHPHGKPEQVRVYDFVDPKLGKVTPYGVYDITANEGWVSVGINHDTAEFAVESIRHWWKEMGHLRYPAARRLMITADCGGSNGYRVRLLRVALQKFADESGLCIQVCHFPPGTSKWNKIEHRMFCHITRNWRGRALESRQIVVNLIGGTKTKQGLHIEAQLDEKSYAAGIKVTKKDLAHLAIEHDEFHGEWNYRIMSRGDSKNT